MKVRSKICYLLHSLEKVLIQPFMLWMSLGFHCLEESRTDVVLYFKNVGVSSGLTYVNGEC